MFERKDKLVRLLYDCEDNIIFSAYVTEGEKSYKFAKDNNLEGIIAKKKNSLYKGERNEDWLKIKCYNRAEFVIGGYSYSDKNELSSLLIGYYNKDRFVYVGKVGTGFSDNKRQELLLLFKKLVRKTNPFSKEIKGNDIIWLKPELVAEIQYVELTKEKVLRQASFIALRQDKKPKDVVLENVNEYRDNKS